MVNFKRILDFTMKNIVRNGVLKILKSKYVIIFLWDQYQKFTCYFFRLLYNNSLVSGFMKLYH